VGGLGRDLRQRRRRGRSRRCPRTPRRKDDQDPWNFHPLHDASPHSREPPGG
jgi:hypothetical protein